MKTPPRRKTTPPLPSLSPAPKLDLRLDAADHVPLSGLALERVKEICEEPLAGNYHLKVIDLWNSPRLARKDGIVGTPVLVRGKPEVGRLVIGSMTDRSKVLAWLRVRP